MAIRSCGARRTNRFARGERRALPSQLVGRIEALLNASDRADALADLDLPGARLHALKGERKGFLALNSLRDGASSSDSRQVMPMLGKWWNTAGASNGCY